MRYTVTAPLPGFTGNVVGVDFKDAVGEVDASTDSGQAAYQFFQRHQYAMTPIEDDEPEQEQDDSQTPPPADEFAPGEHTVDEVLAHLEDDAVDADEARRVLDAEQAGKARAGILGKREQLLADKEGAEQ